MRRSRCSGETGERELPGQLAADELAREQALCLRVLHDLFGHLLLRAQLGLNADRVCAGAERQRRDRQRGRDGDREPCNEFLHLVLLRGEPSSTHSSAPPDWFSSLMRGSSASEPTAIEIARRASRAAAT